MNFKEYDVVALTKEIQAIHKETQQPIRLIPGQVGTILMETVPGERLMLLVYEPLLAFA